VPAETVDLGADTTTPAADPVTTDNPTAATTLTTEPATLTAADATTPADTSTMEGVASVVGLTTTTDPQDPAAPVPAPIESPVAWVMTAAARRQLETTTTSTAPATVDTSQTLASPTTFAAAAVADPDAPPQSPGATVGAPDPTTGAITGTLNFMDPDGDPITYSVTTPPAGGTVAVAPDGTFTYTPTQLTRLNAGSTLTPDYDQFTVAASDGQLTATMPVSLNVYSGQMSTSTTPITVGYGPTAMAVSGDRLYVANTVGNSVSVLDANTGTPLTTLPVGARPSGLAVSPNGQTLYVANQSSNTVSAYSTTTGASLGNIPVAAPQGLAINPAGDRLYVSSIATNRVYAINPVTGATVATIATGATPVGIAVSGDGTRVYVANRGSNTVSTIDAATNRVIGTTAVGTLPQQVALSADGTRLYVTNTGSGDVSVIDTTTGANIATVPVGPSPNGIALSRDGSLAYVVNGNNTMSVIDTASNTKVTGTARAETGTLGYVAVSPDGNHIYVSNSSGNTLRSISLIHVDPPPVTGNPGTGPLFEDFNGPAGAPPNPALWRYMLGAGGSDGQLQAFTNSPANASLDGNGDLVITARQQPVTDQYGNTWPYTSAWLDTQNKFEFTYGTVEARIDLPAAQGLHPTFWLLGSDYDQVGWPQAGEIDILDQFNDAAHAGSGLHGPGYYEVTTQAPIDVTDGFHTFWVRWEPNKITTGVDDTAYAVYTPDSLPPGTPWTFNDRSMYIILDLAVGGIGGPPDATTQFPQSMVVDWVRYTPLDGGPTQTVSV
jgi:YVTN family beta-propeller protein/VCBS repeat-containing protein